MRKVSDVTDSRSILYSKGANDECFTLDYAVKPIIKYIPENYVVWCPFDTKESEFVKQIQKNGNKVIHSAKRTLGLHY